MKLLLSIFLLMCFTLVGYSQKKAKQDTTVYSAVEINPQFPGGEAALAKFVRDHLVFKNGEHIDENGDLITSLFFKFIVEKDGRLTNFGMVKGGLAKYWIAHRIFKAMPKWKPGILNNKAVRVEYVVPINCILYSE